MAGGLIELCVWRHELWLAIADEGLDHEGVHGRRVGKTFSPTPPNVG